MRQSLALLALALLGLTGCDNTSARYSSDYASALSRNEILILPAYAEAYTQEASGNAQRMYDYEGHVEPLLARELETQLKSRGYRARVMEKKDLMTDKTYQEYGAFREAFTEAHKAAYSNGIFISRDKAKVSEIGLSGRAKALGKKLNAPVFAYIDYKETVRSSGAQAADFAASLALALLTRSANSGDAPDKSSVAVAIIDSEHDKVLWDNLGGSQGGGIGAKIIFTDEEQSQQHIHNAIGSALRELPARDQLK